MLVSSQPPPQPQAATYTRPGWQRNNWGGNNRGGWGGRRGGWGRRMLAA